MAVDVTFGQTVRWRDAGSILSGRVTFVDLPSVRVVPDGASEQEWRWIDIERLVDDEPAEIPGQLDIFGGVA